MFKASKSIQTILYTSFLWIALTLLFLLTGLFSWIQYGYLRKNAEADVQRTCSSIASDIDLQISEMDTVCLNIINSTSLKKTFSQYLQDKENAGYLNTLREATIANTLTAMEGVASSIRQINLYGYVNGGYGTGNLIGPLSEDSTQQSWYNDVILLQGRRYLGLPTQHPELSASSGTNSDRHYLSLIRMYYNSYHNPLGFVEIMKYYDVLFDSALYPNSVYDLDITISRSDGTILFPRKEAGQQMASLSSSEDTRGEQINQKTKKREYFCRETAEYSDLVVTVSLPVRAFTTPILRSLFLTFFVCLLMFFLCLLYSSVLARRISAPLKKIYHYLQNLDPHEQFRKIDLEDTRIIEIDKLSHSLNDAFQDHREALQSMLLLKEQELQAQMLALQSQMNPHFLYNSLNNISAMAEEGMTSSVVQMCQDITSILRYISSNKEPVSSLEEELEHCNLYLKCMRLRFGDSLIYDFDIEDDMLEIPVPKLCIQLLVENAVKFSAQVQPPWHILIRGNLTEDSWYVEVRDRGPGFQEETTRQLREKMDEILENGLLPSLALDGMGILNIFVRFYLTYGKSFLFRFGNLPEGGAYVQIGGYFHEQGTTL